jgi:hypothetical protein
VLIGEKNESGNQMNQNEPGQASIDELDCQLPFTFISGEMKL